MRGFLKELGIWVKLATLGHDSGGNGVVLVCYCRIICLATLYT